MPPAPALTAAIKTLGCKLNQYESEQLRQNLTALGCRMVPFEGVADVYVINSCTVTSRTDRDCRRLIRHARKLNPAAVIAVTGCYAEVSPEALEAIPEADLVVGNEDKAHLAGLIRERLGDALPPPGPDPEPACGSGGGVLVEHFDRHTRAFVKVQEGCDARCAYCVIPVARGPSRSVPFPHVLEQARRLVDAGHPEIVLIGTHLGKYGDDLPAGPDLAGAVATLVDLPGLGRLRLSSIEPREVSPPLIDLVAHHPRVCRHLHIPLQSGCDTVLERMGRPYDTAFYAGLLDRIAGAGPGICVGADVMVGFPGETEPESTRTVEFISALPIAYLHAFTYSRRPGTPAADMPDQVPGEVKRARNHVLRDLSETLRQAFARGQVGQALEAVLERPLAESGEVLDGITDNYLRVHARGPASLLGSIRRIRVTGAAEGVLSGEILPPE